MQPVVVVVEANTRQEDNLMGVDPALHCTRTSSFVSVLLIDRSYFPVLSEVVLYRRSSYVVFDEGRTAGMGLWG